MPRERSSTRYRPSRNAIENQEFDENSRSRRRKPVKPISSLSRPPSTDPTDFDAGQRGSTKTKLIQVLESMKQYEGQLKQDYKSWEQCVARFIFYLAMFALFLSLISLAFKISSVPQPLNLFNPFPSKTFLDNRQVDKALSSLIHDIPRMNEDVIFDYLTVPFSGTSVYDEGSKTLNLLAEQVNNSNVHRREIMFHDLNTSAAKIKLIHRLLKDFQLEIASSKMDSLHTLTSIKESINWSKFTKQDQLSSKQKQDLTKVLLTSIRRLVDERTSLHECATALYWAKSRFKISLTRAIEHSGLPKHIALPQKFNLTYDKGISKGYAYAKGNITDRDFTHYHRILESLQRDWNENWQRLDALIEDVYKAVENLNYLAQVPADAIMDDATIKLVLDRLYNQGDWWTPPDILTPHRDFFEVDPPSTESEDSKSPDPSSVAKNDAHPPKSTSSTVRQIKTIFKIIFVTTRIQASFPQPTASTLIPNQIIPPPPDANTPVSAKEETSPASTTQSDTSSHIPNPCKLPNYTDWFIYSVFFRHPDLYTVTETAEETVTQAAQASVHTVKMMI